MGIVKSPYDPKEYRCVRLENGIVALLISDPRTKRPRPKSKQKRRKGSASSAEDVDCTSEEDGWESEEDEEEEESGNSDCEDGDGVGVEEGGVQTTKEEKENNPIQSACAVCVKVGSFSDPADVLGMAHLLEHMVFMGSEKYPGENTFDSFTTRHGGYDNASTDHETTVFEFCIQHQHFKEALDMFAHFFASPLLHKRSLDREIEAVDSEFQTSIQSDSDRIQQLLCSIANPDHPFAKFCWGNTESLKKGPKKKGIDLAGRLKEFHRRMYSSHYMTVTVLSCDPLDTLEQWVRESFSPMPHNQLPCPSFRDAPVVFDEAIFHKLYKVVPVKDTHEIHLNWILPCLYDQYRVKPLQYLGWLLGHEGEGSVLSFLKKKNLATAICAGNSGLGYEYNSCFSLFCCTITLSDKGFERISECLTVVFQYLKLLREVGPDERIFKEIQVVEENEFNFKEEEEAIDYVEKLCESMQLYPEEDFLTGDDLLFEYNPEVIASVQNQLTPERVNIMWLSKRFAGECHEKERWFGTQYSHEAIPSEWETNWLDLELHPSLHLPPPNRFIATDFSLKEADSPASKYPVVIEECEKYKLWFRQDTVFSCPRAWICVLFKTSMHLQSLESAALMDLFLNLLVTNVAEISYAADVAQLEYSLKFLSRGIALTMSGLNHKLPLLFECLIDHIASFTTTEENFAMAKEEVGRSYHNSVLKPKKLCKISRLKLLEFQYYSVVDKMAVLEALTMQQLIAFVTRLKKQLFVEALVQGNITAQEAKGLMTYICTHLEFRPLPPSLHIQPRTMQLPSNTSIRYPLTNRDQQSPNTVIIDYYQCSPATARDTAISSLLATCMEEPCFDALRTKKQLGYEVYTLDHCTHGIMGLSLTLVTQASKYSVEYASGCMLSFVTEFHETLSSWSSEEFQAQVDSLIQDRLEPDISLEEEVLRNWYEVILQKYQFDRLEAEVRELRTVSQEEVCQWLRQHTHPGEHYRKLSVEVVSHHQQPVPSPNDQKPSKMAGSLHSNSNHTAAGDYCDSPRDPVCVVVRDSELESFKQTLFIYPSTCGSSS